MKTKKTLLTMAVFTLLSLSAPTAYSQSASSSATPPVRGPGMMGNYGPGQGPGGGYGPGMMGGGYGHGMMGGGYGYGPGMMGQGYGPGGGYGPGMMGAGPLYMLDLNDEQLAKVNQIRDESRRKNWDTMGKLLDERARMRDLMNADKRDPGAIGKQSMKLADLRRQMLESAIDSQNRIDALLSKEQRDQLRSWRRHWMQADE